MSDHQLAVTCTHVGDGAPVVRILVLPPEPDLNDSGEVHLCADCEDQQPDAVPLMVLCVACIAERQQGVG